MERRPNYITNLRRIRVLLIDELGQLTGQQMEILDTLLQKIHGTTEHFGGIHVIATIDQMQLLISDADSIYHYRPLKFYYQPFCLQFLMRATCPRQRELLKKLRMHPKTPIDIDRIIRAISDGCNFANYADLPIEDPCLTTKKKGREIIARARTDAIAVAMRIGCRDSHAIDSVMSRGGVQDRQITDKAMKDKISQNSSLPDMSKFFVQQSVHSAMIIRLGDATLIPRCTFGVIIAIVDSNIPGVIELITVDFGTLGIHNVSWPGTRSIVSDSPCF